MAVEKAIQQQDPSITFSDEDYEGTVPHQDDSMVVSVITAKYKKLGLPESDLEECPQHPDWIRRRTNRNSWSD
ncbi:hypothetical protein CR513_34119, partial [Mucuna pruriens]